MLAVRALLVAQTGPGEGIGMAHLDVLWPGISAAFLTPEALLVTP